MVGQTVGKVPNKKQLHILQLNHSTSLLPIVTKKEVLTMKFINELGVVHGIVDLILLYWDNNGAIVKAKRTTVSSKNQMSTQGMPFDLRNH